MLLEQVSIGFTHLRHFGADYKGAIALIGVLRVEILMVGFSLVELTQRLDFGNDRLIKKSLCALGCLLKKLSFLFIAVDHDRTVLATGICALTIPAGRVMTGEENIEDSFTTNDFGVEIHAYHLVVAGLTGAHRTVVGVGHLTATIAAHAVLHPAQLTVDRVQAPEASAAEYETFSCHVYPFADVLLEQRGVGDYYSVKRCAVLFWKNEAVPCDNSGMAEQNTHKIPTLEQVVQAFHELYPPSLQAGWDKSGLIAGRAQDPVERILFAVDALDATAREAVDYGAGLMITHHPLLLRGVSFLPDTDYKGSVLHTLIGGGCGLLAAHTNVDSAVEGTNESLCRVLGLTDCVPLTEPATQALDGVEYAVGTGRVGRLEQPVTLNELAQRLARALPGVAAPLRVAGRADQMIERVALCSGSGDSLFDAVRAANVDVYITADLRHHPASEFREQERARGSECALIDCSHAASESLWMQRAGERVQALLAEQGYSVEFRVSTLNTDPWDFTVNTADTPGSASTL